MPRKKQLITVVIPLKNTKEYHRETKRLRDCLYSLQKQTIPPNQIDVIVADIDSEPYYQRKHKEICTKHKARYVFTKTDDIWNISRARNIGIRNARAKYVMTTDVDCIFAPNFIEIILKYVAENRIIHCRISDLPQDYDDNLDNFPWMNKISALRSQYGYGGCQVFPKLWAFKVHGFDEEYKGWGADDTDFYHRAIQDGLENIWLEKETSFFHQWHPIDNRMEDRNQVNENRLRLKLTEIGRASIIRNPSGWGGKGIIYPSTTLPKKRFKDIAILVTTFMRDKALFRCIESIRQFYPDIAIFIGDNGKANNKKKEFCKKHNCIYVKAPFDCGVGATRNAVFKKISPKYKYVMICEDDILFTYETRLDNWLSILEADEKIGIVGGILKKDAGNALIDQHYEAWLYAKAAMLYVERLEAFDWRMDCSAKYGYCDIVMNVFMMRRTVWNNQKWDPNIKTWPEHEDFFFSLKKNTDWKVAYTDTVSLIHKPTVYEQKYSGHRMRTEGIDIFAKKWGIEYIWNSWHKAWGKPNPMRIAVLVPKKKLAKAKVKKMMKAEIAIGIKTFLREKLLFETIDAIKKHFPLPYKLYIADDGAISDEKEYRYQRLEAEGHVIIRLSPNYGISVGRNSIIKRIVEPYVMITDDDIVLQDSKSILNMKSVLDSNADIGLCSGMLFTESGDFYKNENYQKGLRFEIDRGLLFRYPASRNIQKTNGSKFVYADQVVNFFLAKRELFNEVIWDNQIKVEYEHMDFFLRLKKTNWKAAVCLDAKAIHLNPIDDPTYKSFRDSAPKKYFLDKHGLHNTINRFH